MQDKHSKFLPLIAAFKLLKAAGLIVVAFELHRLLRGDVAAIVTHWAQAARVDPQNRIIHRLIEKLTGLSRRRLEAFSIGTLIYAGLFGTEGIGLLLKKRWAEYLTIVSTMLFLPVEVWELVRHATVLKVVVLVLNILIVIYLIVAVRKGRRRS